MDVGSVRPEEACLVVKLRYAGYALSSGASRINCVPPAESRGGIF